jgi:hypothetical protein
LPAGSFSTRIVFARHSLTENPDVGQKDASAAISKKVGKKVSHIYVSNIKSMMGKSRKKRGRKTGPKAGRARPKGAGGLDLPMIEGFMAMVRRMGKATAKRLMDLFE